MRKNAEIGTANIVGTSPASDQTDGNVVATRSRGRLVKLGTGVAGVALVAAGCSIGGNATPSPSPTPAHSPLESGDPDYQGKPEGPDFTFVSPPSSGKKFTETRQYDVPGNPDTFTDYHRLIGVGPEIPKGKTVEVDCVVYDPGQYSSSSTQGTFYHIAGSRAVPGLDGKNYFTPSNTFYNQPDIGGPEQNNLYDPQVPGCNVLATGETAPSPQMLPPIHGTHGG